MADFESTVQLRVNDSQLTAAEQKLNAIKSMSPIPIKIEVDQEQIKEVKSLLTQMSKMKLNLGNGRSGSGNKSGGSGGGSKVPAASLYKETLKWTKKAHQLTMKEMDYQAKGYTNLNTIKSQKSVANLQLKTNYNPDKLSSAERKALAKVQTQYRQDEALRQSDIMNRQELARTNQEFKNYLNTYKEFGKLRGDMQKYEEGSAQRDLMQQRMTALNQQMAASGFNYQNLSESQKLQVDSVVQQNAKHFQSVKYNMDMAKAVEADRLNAMADEGRISSLRSSFESFLSDNNKVYGKYGDQIKSIQEGFKNVRTVGDLEKLNKEVTAFEAAARNAGATGKTFFGTLKDGLAHIGAFFSVGQIMMWGKQFATAVIGNVKDLDTAMTELRKVTDNTASEYAAFREEVKKTSIEIGTTQKEMINSTADFARLGYNLDDAKELAKYANIYKNVGDMDIDSATTYMISTLKGFNMQANDALHIVDAYNRVGNDFAISSAGLGDAMTRSGAALNAAGNTLEQSIGLIVAANDSVQNTAQTGTMLKTFALRLRGATAAELEEAGIDTTGMANARKSIVKIYKSMAGVDIMEADGKTYRSTYAILDDLADKWSSLSDAERAAISEATGGKRGGTVMASLMQNWQDARNATDEAINSAGSALEENEKIINSIEGRLNQFRSAFESFSGDLLGTEFVKSFIQGGTAAITVLDKIITKLGVLGTIAAGFTAWTFMSGFVQSLSVADSVVGALGNTFKTMGIMGRNTLQDLGKFATTTSGQFAVATVAIAASYAVWDHFTESYDEIQEAYSQAKARFEDAGKEADELEQKLQENRDRIAEIHAQGRIGIVDKGEIASLQQANDLLRDQIILKREAQDNEQLAMNNSANKLLTSAAYSSAFGGMDTASGAYKALNFLDFMGTASLANIVARTNGSKGFSLLHGFDQTLYERTDALLGRLNESYLVYDDNTHSTGHMERVADNKEMVDEIRAQAIEVATSLQQIREGASEADQKLIDEYLVKLQDGLIYTHEEFVANRYQGIVESGLYDKAIDKLKTLGQQGRLSVEAINKDASFDDFIKACDELGISVSDVVNEFRRLDEATAGSGYEISDIDQRKTQLESFVTSLNSANKALSESVSGTGLSVESKGFMESAGYADALEDTGNGIRVNILQYEKLRKAQEAVQGATYSKDLYDDRKQLLLNERALEDYRAQLVQYQREYRSADEISKLQQQISATEYENEGIREHIKDVEDLRAQYEGLTNAFAKWQSAQDLAESNDSIKALSGAYEDTKGAYESGEIGTNKFRAAMQLTSYEDISGIAFSEESAEEAWSHYHDIMMRYANPEEDLKEGMDRFLSDLNSAADDLDFGKVFETFDDGTKKLSLTSEQADALAQKLGINKDFLLELANATEAYGVSFDFVQTELTQLELLNDQIQAAKITLDEFRNSDGTINFDLEGASDAAAELANLLMEKRQFEDPVIMRVDTSNLNSDLGFALDTVQSIQSKINEIEVKKEIGLDTSSAEADLSQLVSALTNTDPEIRAKLGLDTEDINAALSNIHATNLEVGASIHEGDIAKIQAGINGITEEKLIQLGVNSAKVDAYKPEEKQSTVVFSPDYKGVYASTVPTLYSTVSYSASFRDVYAATVPKLTGKVSYSIGKANGTAHVGRSFARGTLATGGTLHNVLMGELGTEGLVTPDGRYREVGVNGAEFISKIPKGSIIFNHAQWAAIKNRGNVTGGSAFASGTDNKVDFVDMLLSRSSTNVEMLKKLAETYNFVAGKIVGVNNVMDATRKEIANAQKAYREYMSEANSISLSESYKSKVRNGTLDIASISSESTRDKIEEYKKWYEKAQDVHSSLLDLNADLKELSSQKLDLIEERMKSMADYYSALVSQQEAIEGLAEIEAGYKDVETYVRSIGAQYKVIEKQYDKFLELQEEVDKQLKSGEIVEYSNEWYEAKQAVVEANTAWVKSKQELLEIKEALREANWESWNLAVDAIEHVNKQLDSTISLISSLTAFDESGGITQNGISQANLYASSLKNARQKVADYQEAINTLNKEYQLGIINQADYNEELQDYTEKQMSAVSSVRKYREEIVSLVKDGIKAETSAMSELISKRKDALKQQKDNNDYAEKIKEKQKEISKIQAQITALSGDDTASTRAQIRSLQAKLQSEQDDLDKTRRDHEYSVLTQGYDDALKKFKENQDARTKELNSSLAAQEDAINSALSATTAQYEQTYNQLTELATMYGYSLDTSVSQPWKDATTAVQEYSDAVKIGTANAKIATENATYGIEKLAGTNPAAVTTADAMSFANGHLDEMSKATVEKRSLNDVLTSGSSSSSSSSSGGSTNFGSGNLKVGSRGDAVRNLQIALNSLMGAGLSVDGIYGSKTASAVRAFQKKYGLSADGIFGKNSRAKLKSVYHAASGAYRALSGLYMTDEYGLGSEAIITKDGVLRQLNAGDMVFSARQKEMLWRLSKMSVPSILSGIGGRALSGALAGNMTITNHYDSLLTVNGNVDKDALPGLKDLLRQSYEYTKQELTRDMAKRGFR